MAKNKVLVIDIETNDLLSNMLDYSSFPYKLNSYARMWCVVITNEKTGESVKAELKDVTKEWVRENLKGATHIVAHNGIKFDFPVLKLFGVLEYTIGYPGESDTVFGEPVIFVDSLIVSRLLNPDRYKGHSLDSWGERVGVHKTDFRGLCIEKGYIQKTDPRGQEFRKFCPEMTEYCIQDTVTNASTFKALVVEMDGYEGWNKALKMENKLADLGIRRETFGFYFDKELAVKCVEELNGFISDLTAKVDPILPPRKMKKGELAKVTPSKNQITKTGTPTAAIKRFVERLGCELYQKADGYFFDYKEKTLKLPVEIEPLETTTVADISNLDHVKMHLINLGWDPVEWRERDLTKDSTKKKKLTYEKRIEALNRWWNETVDGKYTEGRLEDFNSGGDEIYHSLAERLREDYPVRVKTSPCIRVGVEKELCPNLTKVGEKVAFAKDFALYLTYKHRRSCIAGGDIEEMDFDIETPNTGYLSCYREEDGRIPTPAIEIGAATNRYRHISVANVARASSEYGKELRSLFGAGKGFLQLGFDFASLENRIQGHYIYKYENGPELAVALIAEKPNDIHTLNGIKLGISRSDAKSLTYALLYGAAAPKIAKMLNISLQEAKRLVDEFWNSVAPLRDLKAAVEKYWETTGNKYLVGIDGRKIFTRSKHSLLNSLFQSGGVICAKYTTVLLFQKLEKDGYCIDPFEGKPDVCSMIEYHDENQLAINPEFAEFEQFNTKEEAEKFVENWEGDQLSDISYGTTYYVAKPNKITRYIQEAIDDTDKAVGLNVPLGFAYAVHKNWYGCH